MKVLFGALGMIGLTTLCKTIHQARFMQLPEWFCPYSMQIANKFSLPTNFGTNANSETCELFDIPNIVDFTINHMDSSVDPTMKRKVRKIDYV